jgi:tRNA (guanine37-N1)-methyltransferase
MHFHIVSIFPEMAELASRFGVVGQAVKEGIVTIQALSPRVFTSNAHQTVDDRPFGGGDGMVMLAEPLAQAVEKIRSNLKPQARSVVIHLSPRGRLFSDELARELSGYTDIVLIASRYGGVDQRFLNQCVDFEVSVGDYVLSGGELPALVLVDAVTRLLPGVLGNEESAEAESFAEGLLEHPQYTRPREWLQAPVPEDLLSGDHARIARWKRHVSILVTTDRRPELLLDKKAAEHLGYRDIEGALNILSKMSADELKNLGLRTEAEPMRRALQKILEGLMPEKKSRRAKSANPSQKRDAKAGSMEPPPVDHEVLSGDEGEPSGGER